MQYISEVIFCRLSARICGSWLNQYAKDQREKLSGRENMKHQEADEINHYSMYLFHLPFLIAENQPWGYCFELEVRTTQQWRVNLTLAIKRAAKLGGHWNCYFMNTSMISKSFESKNTVSPAQNSFSPERHKWCRSSTAEAPCLMLHAGMSSGCVLNVEEQLLDQDRRFKVGSP